MKNRCRNDAINLQETRFVSILTHHTRSAPHAGKYKILRLATKIRASFKKSAWKDRRMKKLALRAFSQNGPQSTAVAGGHQALRHRVRPSSAQTPPLRRDQLARRPARLQGSRTRPWGFRTPCLECAFHVICLTCKV